MNVPFTMTVDDAASVLLYMLPTIVYPYHYQNQDGTFADLNRLKILVAASGVEVRQRKWY